MTAFTSLKFTAYFSFYFYYYFTQNNEAGEL